MVHQPCVSHGSIAAAFGIGLEPENFSQRSAAGDCKTIVSHVYM